jgi:hypothetical protein
MYPIIIDLSSEILVDLSKVHEPHLRLLLKAIGQELAAGSAWVAVGKELATHYRLSRRFFAPQGNAAVA